MKQTPGTDSSPAEQVTLLVNNFASLLDATIQNETKEIDIAVRTFVTECEVHIHDGLNTVDSGSSDRFMHGVTSLLGAGHR